MKRQGAILGFGAIAEKGHWPSYAAATDCEIVAVMDPSEPRRGAAKALQPTLRTYATADEFFRIEKVDFVDICTPPASHAVLALQALKCGMHVLCEKPLVLSERDYVALQQEAKARQRTVYAVHNWKYAPIIQKALALIREGHIGPVWHVELFVLRDNACKGSAGQNENWRQDPAVSGGGILVDHGWHAFYLLTSLVGAAPESVIAKMLFAENGASGLDEAAQALVKFPAADGYIHLTWRAQMRRNSINIQGVNGTLLIDDDRLLLNARDGKREEFQFDPLSAGSHHADWFQALLPDFLEEVKNPAKRGLNLEEAGWCVALTSAAYSSNLQGFKDVDVVFPGQKRKDLAAGFR
jgi:predicted dehydrogenase